MTSRPIFRALSLAALVCVSALLVACKSDMEVKHGFGAGVTFEATGETFMWIANADQRTGNAYLDNPSLRNLIRNTIEAGFISRGYRKVATAADFIVEYTVGHRRRLEDYTGASFTEYDEGSLVVTVRNPDSNEVVWWGGATAKLDAEATPEQRRKHIQDAVDRMMEYVPFREPAPVGAG